MDIPTYLSAYSAQISILMNACVALILGGAIGFERELKGRPAGMRTHMLVAVSASLFVNLSQLMSQDLLLNGGSSVNFDPSRALVAIVTGVSFLGAGTIFRSEDGVLGLTTAATLLFVSALGITIALEEYLLATALTILILLVLRLMGIVDLKISKKNGSRE